MAERAGASSPRRDAAENRARIVAAARSLLRDSEAAVLLSAVARRAQVGQATLYRHFPTRDDLLAEVYRADVDALVAAADELLADRDPLPALEGWLERLLDYARIKRGVLTAVEASAADSLAADSEGPISRAIGALLDAGRRDGSLRADVDARDVILLIGSLTRLREDEWPARARHLLAIVLDGLRTR